MCDLYVYYDGVCSVCVALLCVLRMCIISVHTLYASVLRLCIMMKRIFSNEFQETANYVIVRQTRIHLNVRKSESANMSTRVRHTRYSEIHLPNLFHVSLATS